MKMAKVWSNEKFIAYNHLQAMNDMQVGGKYLMDYNVDQ